VARIGVKRNACKTEGKRLLERSRRRWEDNIKMDIKGTEFDGWFRLI
jgi:hypothetical protein